MTNSSPTPSTAPRFVVIMAGGTGTRLWPLSRKAMPKQFLNLIGETTLLQATYERVRTVIPDEQILVMADAPRVAIAKEQLPQIPPNNFIIEPEGRDNGPAIALVSLILEERSPGCEIAILWSDHSVEHVDLFASVLLTAFSALQQKPNHLVSIGIKPTRPATEYGYIHLDHELKLDLSEPVFTVSEFVEKPDHKTAVKYANDWRYLWNTGYQTFRARHMLDLFQEHQPTFYDTLLKIGDRLKENKEYGDLFGTLDKKAIEPLITEKTTDILAIPADLGWSDIGSWDTLHSILKNQQGKDVIARGEHIDIGSKNCLVISEKRLVATAGLEDVMIIDTPDALLVIDKHSSQKVKELVAQLQELKADHLL